jgi:hypothetical protein
MTQARAEMERTMREAMRLRYRVYDKKQNIVGRVGDAYDAASVAMRGDRYVTYAFTTEGDDAGRIVWHDDLQSDRWLRGPDGDEPTLLDIVRQITNQISDIRDAEDEQRRDAEEMEDENRRELHEEQAQKYGAEPSSASEGEIDAD